MVTPRSRKTRFKSKIAKVVFGHLFLSTKNRSEIVSISSRRVFCTVTDYRNKVAESQNAHFCTLVFDRFWSFWGCFRANCDCKTTF
jgi:hypothetical protein